ncbi:hypothetical protein F7P84_15385 [Edwardsiella anguillarum]|nr:hypothetical protein F7P84_15385 [Edwardsiella anguillarum]QBB14558.1 hypothetical protein EVK84_18545 [Edwardsiella piscicida]
MQVQSTINTSVSLISNLETLFELNPLIAPIEQTVPLLKVRLSDLPQMPAEQVIPLLRTMPEWCGEAIAKMCCSQISAKHS